MVRKEVIHKGSPTLKKNSNTFKVLNAVPITGLYKYCIFLANKLAKTENPYFLIHRCYTIDKLRIKCPGEGSSLGFCKFGKFLTVYLCGKQLVIQHEITTWIISFYLFVQIY